MEKSTGYNPETTDQEYFSGEEITGLLSDEIARMQERNFGEDRTDPKFVNLRGFLQRIKGRESFESAHSNLPDPERHGIITRLENIEVFLRREQDQRASGFHQQVVEPLQRQLYGTDSEGS